MELDSIDKNCSIFFRKIANKRLKELSHKLDLSVTAVYERIKKLEKQGVISKYVALIDKK